ncbi:transcription factor S-II, central domain-containing protein [Sphaerosporella brunnea]|uniref:Transcription elongation factor n=1 Tax=Sphaerosporella brunnea TaxID=1250544 RepID=A0A5J5EDL3_9PEZI|nr:transcription factor S-II, central domain-containing protein [Sphaerosporella brunnea]
MDAKEVLTHVGAIDKAMKEKLPPSALIDLLTSLKKGVVATEKLLRDTKVGMAVNKLRTHSDKAVSDLAKEIVVKWKQDVGQKSKQPAARSQDKSRATASPTIAQNPIPSPKKGESKSRVDSSKGSAKEDLVDLAITGDATRDRLIGVLYNALCLESDATPDRILTLAKSLEADVFINHKKKLELPYKKRIQTLYINLKDKKNPNLRKRVISGEISTGRLATMETHEMASEELQGQYKAIQEANLRESMVAKPEKSISDQLQCGKCGKKKVSYTQAQTRSADEPMTTFCTCEHCGNMWKFS